MKTYPLLIVLISAMIFGFACSEVATGEKERGTVPRGDRTSSAPSGTSWSVHNKEVELSAKVRRAHHAFRRNDEAMVGGGLAYEAMVKTGRLTVAGRNIVNPDTRLATRLSSGPVTFETIKLGRASAMSSERSSQTLTKEGEVAIRRGALTERIKNTPDGVSQSWEIPTRPAGTGDFTVHLAVSGQSYVGETSEGLHFVDEATGIGTRYGHATWIAADGSTTHVAARHLGRDIVLRVPETVVNSSAYPVVLDPVIGPEFGLDEPVTLIGDGFNLAREVAANDAGLTLIVYGWEGDIFALRMKPDGELLDVNPLLVATSEETEVYAEVSSDGEDFLVVWQQGEPGANLDLYGARVSADGTVLDPVGFPISRRTPYNESVPSIAFDGENYFLVWALPIDQTNGVDIFGARVTTAGTVLDPDGFSILAAPGNQSNPHVAFDGTNFLAVWADNELSQPSVQGARVSPDGSVLDPGGFVISTGGVGSDVAFSGSNYLVVWKDTDIYGARVAPDGTLLDTNPFLIETAIDDLSCCAVTGGATNFLVGWTTGSDVFDRILHATRVGPGGAVLDTTTTLTGLQRSTTIARSFDGTNFWAIYGDSQYNKTVMGLAIGDNSGSVVAPGARPIAALVASERHPAVASNGVDFLAVWRDERRSLFEPTTYGLRLTPSGTALDSAAFPIATGTGAEPKIASDGSNYLVVWEDVTRSNHDIHAVRVSANGEVLDPSPITISAEVGDQLRPQVAHDGTGYFIVWEDERSNSGEADIYGARVANDGTVLDLNGVEICTAEGSQRSPSVASNGSEFFVAWHGPRRGTFDEVYGARVAPDGSVLDPQYVPITEMAAAQRYPTVASDGTDFLVAWEGKLFTGTLDIFSARIAADGTVLDQNGLVVTAESGTQQAADAGYDGTTYFVAWSDNHNGRFDTYGARVDSNDALIDQDGWPLGVAAQDEERPAIAFNAGGTGLAVYIRDESDTAVFARVFLANCTPTGSDESSCDGVDDDCDGQTDEDYVPTSTECGTGKCFGTGELNCVGGEEDDSCAPPADAGKECFPEAGTGGVGDSGNAGGSGNPTGAGGSKGTGSSTGTNTGASSPGDGSQGPEEDEEISSTTRRSDAESGGCDCGCKVAQSPARPVAPWSALTLLCLVWLRRKKRSTRLEDERCPRSAPTSPRLIG